MICLALIVIYKSVSYTATTKKRHFVGRVTTQNISETAFFSTRIKRKNANHRYYFLRSLIPFILTLVLLQFGKRNRILLILFHISLQLNPKKETLSSFNLSYESQEVVKSQQIVEKNGI